MKTLVTGADGFIGSHLTELLVRQGHQVKALAQYNSFNSWGWLEQTDCRDDIEIVTGDVRDPALCGHLMQDVGAVFHLAALIAIPYSYIAPDSYVDTNVKGTLNICQAARDAEVSRLIHLSTSEIYGTAQYVPIDEKHPIQPQSPYSATKIAADAMAMSFHNSFGLPVTIARPFNTYGPRQSARAVIPSIITQIASGKSEIQLGDTTPTRDFNYVTDTCRAISLLAACDDAVGKTINIASNSEISIQQTFDLINEMMGGTGRIVSDQQRMRPSGSEVYRLYGDNSELVRLTGYQPSVGLKEGLQHTIKWLSDQDNLSKYKADI
jgi:NAD dependent epimerase/dehydratase